MNALESSSENLDVSVSVSVNSQFIPKASRNRGGNGGARPRNAETAGARVSFRPRNNLPSLSAG